MRRLALLVLPVLIAACGDSVSVEQPSEAMAPTIKVGEEVTFDQAAFSDQPPRKGDVVLFSLPRSALGGGCAVPQRSRQACPAPAKGKSDARSVFRIVAGPGDRVAFRRGRAVVDGEPEKAGSIQVTDPGCERCDLPVTVTLPKGHFFLAGDNRSVAADSREFGPVPKSFLEGRLSE